MEHRVLGLVGILALSTALTACAGAGAGAIMATGRDVAVSAAISPARVSASASAPTPPHASARELGLRAGDFVVYRFSGSFRKGAAAPLLLTQRVIGRDGGVISLEIVLEDGKKQEMLRVRKDATPGSAEEVFDVTRVEGGIARSASVDAYAALMGKTVLAADQNEAELGAEETSVRLGDQTLRCRKTSYRVRVGKHLATMSTIESNGFPWGDVGGDITTADGQVLYRVEVVEAGNATHERSAGPVAIAR
jgi:hypothetical protein